LKLKASALSFAIFVVFIIGIAMSSMLLMQSSSNQIIIKHSIQRKLIHNAKSGIYHYMMNQEEVDEGNQIVDLFGTGLDSVKLESENWGAFKIVHSMAFARRDTFKKSAFVGENLLNENNTVLYLADKNSPLSICGQTEIRGEVFLPKSGVKRAYIEGQNYNGDKLIYGKENRSERFLPDLNPELKSLLKDPSYSQEETEQIFYEEEETDSIYKSFSSEGLHLFSLSPIYINNQFLSGKIKIESSQSIHIGRDALLNDVIVIAPEVRIESDFVGRLQIYSNNIMIEKGATLEHPSVAMLFSDSEEIAPELSIEEDVLFEGTIISYGKQRAPAQILIEKSEINGVIYNNGLTQIKGNINGSLYSSELVLKTASSVYKNHLLNVGISMDEDVKKRCFPNLLLKSKYNTISEWLN